MNVARKFFQQVLNGGDNYFMDSDFNSERILKTEFDFYKEINQPVSRVNYIKGLQFEIEDDSSNNSDLMILSIISSLQWLDEKSLLQSIDNDMLTILKKLEASGVYVQSAEYDREAIKKSWHKSNTPWDLFLKQESMFEDIGEYPCLILYQAKKINPALKFLEECQAILNSSEFSKIIDFMILEINNSHMILEATKTNTLSFLGEYKK
ncbi:hypothetical protein [Diaphorobacter aerolatus]|nr:hypothetical protein [Diaphorobacter aerolatus]